MVIPCDNTRLWGGGVAAFLEEPPPGMQPSLQPLIQIEERSFYANTVEGCPNSVWCIRPCLWWWVVSFVLSCSQKISCCSGPVCFSKIAIVLSVMEKTRVWIHSFDVIPETIESRLRIRMTTQRTGTPAPM